MPDQADWNFAGPDDAKAEIRAAVLYLLKDATADNRADIVLEIIQIVRDAANGLLPRSQDPFDGEFPGG
jgi:hypothetical protein